MLLLFWFWHTRENNGKFKHCNDDDNDDGEALQPWLAQAAVNTVP
jgi:hypothetical protein